MRQSNLALFVCWIFVLLQTIQKKYLFVKAGQIFTKDYSIDYLNVGYTTQIKFTFQLQNGLGAYNYLQLTFPFLLYTNKFTDVQVKYVDETSTGCTLTPTLLPATITQGTSNNIYYILFLDAASNPTSLKAAPQWYSLYIYPQRGFIVNPGIQSAVQAATLSAISVTSGQPIQYDLNNAFANLEFISAPPTTLQVTPFIPSPQKTQVAWSYDVSFQILPTIAIKDQARIMILFQQPKYFKFTGTCVSEQQVVPSGNIPPLDPSLYSCNYDTLNNRIVIQLFTGLKQNLSYRFRVTVINPNHSIPTAGFEVRTLMGFSNQIIEQATLNQAIYTSYLTLNLYKVFLSNTIDLSDSSFVTKAAIMAQQNFYNPFKFYFQISLDIPDSTKLKIVIQIPIGALDSVLTGSIRYNFPRFDPNVPVQCILDSLSPPQNIICTEIGKLLLTQLYYVTISISFANNIQLNSNFGTMTVYSEDLINNAELPMIQATKPNILSQFFTIQNNLDRVDYSSSQYGYQMVHSQVSYDNSNNKQPLQPLSPTNYGLKSCNNVKQKLVFAWKKGPNNQFGVNPNFAMRLVTSTVISAQSNQIAYVESKNAGCNINNEFNSAATASIITYNTFTEILINPQTTSNCIQSESITSVFSIGDVIIQGMSSSYGADQSSINFYGALYDSYTSNRAPTSYFAVNAFTISQGTTCSSADLQNVQIGISNFYTSQGAQNGMSDGSQFPAFIRVTGYLKDAEKIGGQRIAVFFNNVNFFTESTDNYGRQIVSCSSNLNYAQQCWGYNGQQDQSSSIHTMKRVEFDVSTTISQIAQNTPFQLLIPVSSIGQSTSVRLFVSVMTNFANDNTQSQTFVNSFTMSQFQLFTGTTNAPQTSSANISYRLDSTAKIEGGLQDADLFIGHNGGVSTINRNVLGSPTQMGSAFVIVGLWQMYSKTLSVTANQIVNTSVASENCIGFRYFFQSTQMKYGIFCPFTAIGASDPTISSSTKVTFKNFVYPALGPLKLQNTYITWSQNDGNIVTAFQDPVPVDAGSQLQPNIINNVQPVTINRYTKDNKVIWYFTTTNPIPKDGQIQISLVSSGSWLFSVAEKTDANCFLLYKTSTFSYNSLTQCTVTVPVANNILFTLNYVQDFQPGDFQLIQYGFDASVNSIATPYAITVATLTSTGGIIDQQSALPVVNLSFNNGEQWNTVINIISYKYSHSLVSNSIGTFEMQFQINQRPILALSSPGYGNLKGQYLEISVASFIGQYSNINCYLMQNSLAYFGFQNINLSSNLIQVFPRFDILDTSLPFTLHCENVLNQYKNIQQYQVRLLYRSSFEVIKGGTSPSGASNPPYNNPVTFPKLILTRFNSLAGAQTQFRFQISLSAQQINQQTSIFVTFPQKYNPQVGSSYLSCQINNQPVYCTNVGSDRKIQISAFPIQIAAQIAFTIDIYGIVSPPVSAGAGNIQVLVGSSTDPSSIVEVNQLADPATNQDTTNQLQITYATQSNPNARESGIYSYTISSGSGISVNQNIIVEFPQEYGTVINISPPTTCQITSTDSTTTYGSVFQILGSKITIQVSQSIPPNTLFLVSLNPILNPEQSTCSVTKVMISVLSQDLKTNNLASSIASTNQPNIKFVYSTTLKYMNWFFQGVQIIYNQNTIQLVPGVYSNLISLVDPNGNFSKTLQYKLQSSSGGQFQLISDNMIYTGQSAETFNLGCPINTLPGLYTLSFTKVESSPVIYGNLGLINVLVSNTKVQIVPAYTTYKVSVLGQSLPVFFDLSNQIPFSGVSVLFELQIMGLDPKISLLDDNNQPVTQYTINFSPQSYKGKLFVRSTQMISPVLPDHKVQLQMTIFGNDANSYIASTTNIIFQLYDVGQPNPPVLSFTPILQTSNIFQNYITLLISVNVPSAIYYHVCFQSGPIRTSDEVMKQANKYTVLNPMDIYQEQFGILNAEQASNSFTISNLKSGYSYTISTWALDQLQRLSSRQDNTFTTTQNGGQLLRISIQFANIIGVKQKTNLVCYLCQQFAIPCFNVMSFDSIYCEEQSKYKFLIQDQVNLNSRLLFQDKRNLDIITSANTVSFYTLPLDHLSSDSSYNKVMTIVQNPQFALQLNQNDATLPQILSVTPPVQVQPQPAPSLINTPTVSTGLTWFQVSNIQTAQNSFIWMYLIDAPNSGTPTVQQMKFKLTNRNQTSPNFQIMYYNQNNQVTFNYTGLQSNTQYNLYLLATTENPSLFAPTSFVSTIGKSTLSPQVVVVISSKIISFSILIVVFLSLIY
ncbi:transmembrane protein, putative (macronuclear) [Tetrahymena thermophila SB210]|uniref:Transmembrane protein, putative n=1 Tax=Tetrahymena thermophila (strain SB210) TaxID=312017 RepID=I7M4L0_TETTS|nr:transmembrane protein, putative [Tetrahymena thermophila SB210]EAS07562.2 transmembrane protein, putative [Tetrahymena thermophila SB210]|eukprot:XP_001027804.2 transmembrane protein, putative [Tetrahymena thermophila SB210]